MKVWIKYLIGIALGIAAYFILPTKVSSVGVVISGISEFAVRFGRYSLMPLLFFSASYAFFRLRDSRTLLKTSSWTILLVFAFTLILLVMGIMSALIVKIPRIPITGERMTELPSVSIRSLLMQIFPYSGFDSLKDGVYLLPAFVFAGFAGAGCASDKDSSKPVISLFESASRLCYGISSFFVEWFSVGMIAVSCNWILSARPYFESRTFVPLVILLTVDFVIFAVVVCPLVIRLVCKDPRPFRVLYASICPLLASFFSGDSNISLQIAMRHGRESLGIRDETNSFTFPFFSIFSRGGTSLVISICFVTILGSYSGLDIKVEDVVWLFMSAFGLSFMLCSLPSGGTFVALTILCTMYGRGFDAGYLLFRPVAPVLCSFAALFDVTSALYGSYITAVKTRTIDHNEIRHYI
ncbi:dicarboxylate/amino acid:cation symporter [Treponema saccharophilum]|uniref:dicarboxylate/amino acid:cation symporter n=1 Tax=Treponema saccharophilum TaxID=165 RepID=UPI0038699B9F